MSFPVEPTLPPDADVVIVGGGIIGLSIAYEAARQGMRPLVVERDRPGGGATDVAAGMLAPITEARTTEPELTELSLESCRIYPDFVAAVEGDSGRGCRYRDEASLLVAVDRDQLAHYDHKVAEYRSLGFEVEALSGAEVRRREPRLSSRVVGGYAIAGDRQVDPRALAAALVEALEARGGLIVWPATVRSVRTNGAVTGVRLELDDPAPSTGRRRAPPGEADVATRALVVAAGSWSQQALAELAELPMRPVKGQLLRLRGETLLDHVVRSPGVYLVPRSDGELVVGASMEEQGFDDSATAGVIMDLLAEAWRLLPGIYDLELTEVSVGFRPALRDNLPAIGRLGPDGLWVATGHYRHGIMLAPATARHLVRALRRGELPAELEPFDPGRFAIVEGARSGPSAPPRS